MRNRQSPYLLVILLIYTAGYCAFPPTVFMSSDESAYVEQAVVFARGSLANVSPYPPGTSILQAGLVAVAGWRAATGVSLIAAAATVLLMARWLRDAGYPSTFALLFIAYAPTLVMARIGSSDVPSAAVVALALWLYWAGSGNRWQWAAAGGLAGLSVVLRETNVILFLPFVAAALIRRQPGSIVLATGLLAGLLTAALVYWITGAPLPGLRDTAGWSVHALGSRAGIYVVCTLILVPGGLAAIAAYRGRERHALIAAAAAYLAVYVFYDYSAADSDPLARIAALGRYLIPLMPLMTIAWADCVSRLPPAMPVRTLAAAGFVATAIAAFLVHPVLRAWSQPDQDIVSQIATTVSDGALIADDTQRKYVAPVFGRFDRYWMVDTSVGELPLLLERHPAAYIVDVTRTRTSPTHDPPTPASLYVAAVSRTCQVEPVIDRAFGDRRVLRMWEVTGCGERVRGRHLR